MKKLLLSVVIVTIIGCSDKKPWTKEYLVNDCLKEFTKRNEEKKIFNTLQLAKLCDCASETMLVKYKSFKEFDNDKDGSGQIGAECAQQIMQEKTVPSIE